MKINLHCHTIYSDGKNPLINTIQEHKNCGFGAFVATDHLYPTMSTRNAITSWNKYKAQEKELNDLSYKLNIPCFHGVELCLYYEEVLVFGDSTIKALFDKIDEIGKTPKEKYTVEDYIQLMNVIKNHKYNNAVILCHPSLYRQDRDYIKLFYNNLWPILDGYELGNSGINMFKNREIPVELKPLTQFWNSDAHKLEDIDRGNNEAPDNITSIEDIIKYIQEGKIYAKDI